MKPFHDSPVFFHCSKSAPMFEKDLKRKEFPLVGQYKIVTDLDILTSQFSDPILEFLTKYPNSINMIEFGDANRFESIKETEFVFVIEIKINDDIITENLANFVMALADSFACLKLPSDLQSTNKMIRVRWHQKEENKNTKKDNQLTPAQEQRAKKKQDKEAKQVKKTLSSKSIKH